MITRTRLRMRWQTRWLNQFNRAALTSRANDFAPDAIGDKLLGLLTNPLA